MKRVLCWLFGHHLRRTSFLEWANPLDDGIADWNQVRCAWCGDEWKSFLDAAPLEETSRSAGHSELAGL